MKNVLILEFSHDSSQVVHLRILLCFETQANNTEIQLNYIHIILDNQGTHINKRNIKRTNCLS